MNSRQLEHFLAVTRRGTFSGASTDIGVTQSALSQSIAALETEVGSKLFERLSVGVRLTAAGREFAPHAVNALESLKQARHCVRRADRLAGGHLDIACPASLGIDPVPRLVAAFRQEFPDVFIRVHNIPEHNIGERQLFEIGAEVVVSFAELVSPDLHRAPLAPLELLAVVPMAAAPRVSLEQVLRHGLVTTPPDTLTHRFVASRLGRDALEESIAVEVVHTEGVLPLVLSGAGATVLPAGQARVASAMPGLIVCELDPAVLLEVVVALPRSTASAAAHQFMRVCREAVEAA